MKIMLISREEYSFTDKRGENVNGCSYIGILENGTAIKFTSPVYDHDLVSDTIIFDQKKATDLNVKIKLWDGKVKYQEVVDE